MTALGTVERMFTTGVWSTEEEISSRVPHGMTRLSPVSHGEVKGEGRTSAAAAWSPKVQKGKVSKISRLNREEPPGKGSPGLESSG